MTDLTAPKADSIKVARARRTFFGALVGAVIFGFFLTFYLGPIARLLSFSVFDPQQGISLDSFARVLGDPFYILTIANTVKLAVIVTILCVLLAFPVSHFLVTLPNRWFRVAIICVVLPLWTSQVVRTYAWLVILQNRGIVNSILLKLGLIAQPLPLVFNELAVVIGSAHILLPYMILPVYTALARIDRSLYQAAIGLGATRSRAFWRIILPLSWPGVAAGALIVFVLELGIFVLPAILGGGRVLMVAPIIAKEIDTFSNWNVAAVLSTLLLLIAIVCALMSERVARAKLELR